MTARTRCHEPRSCDGLGATLDRNLAERLELEAMCEPVCRLGPDRDRAWCRRRLEAGSDVGRVAERDGLWVRRTHHADSRPTRVESHADGEVGDPPGFGDVARVLPHDLLDP